MSSDTSPVHPSYIHNTITASHLVCHVVLPPCNLVGKNENVRANLQQYGLEGKYIDVLVADAAKSVWRQREIFDAIITDRESERMCLSINVYVEYGWMWTCGTLQ